MKGNQNGALEPPLEPPLEPVLAVLGCFEREPYEGVQGQIRGGSPSRTLLNTIPGLLGFCCQPQLH